MAYDLEEQESIDQMKAWWDQWGTPITAAVCVCCLGFAGWNGWQWYQRNQAAQASGAYVQLQNAIYQNDTKNVKSIADSSRTTARRSTRPWARSPPPRPKFRRAISTSPETVSSG